MSELFEINRLNSREVQIVFNARPLAGSMKYPDPANARDKIRAAGYLCSINRDDSVIARPAPSGAKWYKCDADKLRGFCKEHDSAAIAAGFNDAINAADAELAEAQAVASGSASLSPKATAALNLLNALSADERAVVLARIGA